MRSGRVVSITLSPLDGRPGQIARMIAPSHSATTTSSSMPRTIAGRKFDSPMKRGDEAAARPVVEILGPPDLRHQAFVHDGDAVRHGERFFLVVRDVDEGDAEIGMQAAHLELQVLAQLLVERAQRLVHQQQARLEDDGAGERHPLLLAAGELARIALAVARQMNQLERLADQLRPLRLGDAALLQRESRYSRRP